MPRLISVLLIITVFSSCKTQYAYFQESSYFQPQPKDVKKKQVKIKPIKPQGLKVEPVSKSLETSEVKFDRIFIPIVIAPEREFKIEEKVASSFEHPSQKFFQPTVKQDPKAKKKKKRGSKFRKISSNIFIGFTFLGIAILLAILKVPTLVILFGIASIVFLTIGLKKIWKKKRRRSRFENIFKRKK